MRLCDAHTHFFSRAFFDLLGKQAASARNLRADVLIEAVAREAGIVLPSPSPSTHAGQWLRELDQHAVERAVTFASLPGEAEAVAEASHASGGRLIPFVLVDPTTTAGLEAGKHALQALGHRGILLFPAMHHFDPGSPALDSLYRDCARHQALVIVHCGLLQIKLRDLLGIRPAYDLRFANPISVIGAAEKHRDVHFVLPHFGCGFFRETLLAGAQCPNILIDTSSSNSWMAAQPEDLTLERVFRKALQVFGPRRILFGTDSSTFPRGWRSDLFHDQERALDAIGLSEPDRARILGGNLLELFQIH